MVKGRFRKYSICWIPPFLKKFTIFLCVCIYIYIAISYLVEFYRGYQQQDAHEFLRYMLDRLHTELLHLLPDFTLKDFSHKNKTSIVTSVFGGTLQSEVI